MKKYRTSRHFLDRTFENEHQMTEINLNKIETVFIKLCKYHYDEKIHKSKRYNGDKLKYALHLFNTFYWESCDEEQLYGLNRILFMLWFKITKNRNHNMEFELWELIYNPHKWEKSLSREKRIFYELVGLISLVSPCQGGYFFKFKKEILRAKNY